MLKLEQHHMWRLQVIAEELQGMFKEWRGAPVLLPQVCSRIACTSLEGQPAAKCIQCCTQRSTAL